MRTSEALEMLSDVIRWESEGGYTYAAVLAGGRWYTTATGTNPYIAQVLTHDQLTAVLNRPETSRVQVAVSWVSV